MSKKIRLTFAIILLAVSISLLLWGYLPNRRETLERVIPPAEMQLPTPSSLLPDLEPVS
jgi:uncharacterized membrane protein YwaF